jgi:YesN/AraC family two-component response regulator
MILLIRHMESERCKKIVKDDLNGLGIDYKYVELGEVELYRTITDAKLQMFDKVLKESGLELMVNNRTLLISKIKEAIRQLVYLSDEINKPNTSDYISKRVNYDYNYLSKIFSEVEGITIENYYIRQRIRRVKELLVNEGMSLSDIAFKMLYSSVAHLSNQFKKVTGITPLDFKLENENVLRSAKM